MLGSANSTNFVQQTHNLIQSRWVGNAASGRCVGAYAAQPGATGWEVGVGTLLLELPANMPHRSNQLPFKKHRSVNRTQSNSKFTSACPHARGHMHIHCTRTRACRLRHMGKGRGTRVRATCGLTHPDHVCFEGEQQAGCSAHGQQQRVERHSWHQHLCKGAHTRQGDAFGYCVDGGLQTSIGGSRGGEGRRLKRRGAGGDEEAACVSARGLHVRLLGSHKCCSGMGPPAHAATWQNGTAADSRLHC